MGTRVGSGEDGCCRGCQEGFLQKQGLSELLGLHPSKTAPGDRGRAPGIKKEQDKSWMHRAMPAPGRWERGLRLQTAPRPCRLLLSCRGSALWEFRLLISILCKAGNAVFTVEMIILIFTYSCPELRLKS